MAIPKVVFVPLSLCLMVFGSLLVLLRVAFVIVTHPFTAFKKTRRQIPPACLLDPALGSHEYVTANGIKFHCVSAGDKSKPLMLLVHGFPEFWFSWRHQLREFSRDYHVVAIDMRGYGDTDRPSQKKDYHTKHLMRDVVELVPALGHTSCILVAHDWGGVIAWMVTHNHPELVDKLIVMDCPHSRVLRQKIRSSFKQLLMSWYIFMFQMPKLPELYLSLQDYKALEDCFLGPEMGVKNKACFPPEFMEAYKYMFSQPGALTGPLNYYRCVSSKSSALKPTTNTKIDVPTLIIWGDDDKALSCDMADEHGSICTDVTVRHISNCSHWVQQDAPDLCNQYMRHFLTEEQQ